MSMNKNLCVIPWVHLNLNPDGAILPCCITSANQKDSRIGNINDMSLEEAWNDKKMRKLRIQFMNNKKPEICDVCWKKEDAGGTSVRQHNNAHFPHVIKKIPETTDPDGTSKEFKLRYWDFRFSNLCNYKCRSCGPLYSSAWIPDAKKLGFKNHTEEKILSNDVTNEFIDEHIMDVERIYFAGGEPMLMDQHWYILQKLSELERWEVKLMYNTNLSILSRKKESVLDYWKNFKFVHIAPSIDEIDERAELVRSGTVWKNVEKNLKILSRQHNMLIIPNITVSSLNVFRLPEIIERLMDLGIRNFNLNQVFSPEWYHVSALPDKLRKVAIDKIYDFCLKVKIEYDQNINDKFIQVLYELKKPHNTDAAEQLKLFTTRLDIVRNENSYEIIPELKLLR